VRRFIFPVIHASDCAAYKRYRGLLTSGVYSLYPYGYHVAPLTVYCQFAESPDGDHWTVFQKRFDGSVNFDRDSSEYVGGFGDKSGEYWIGLETLHRMTRVGVWELRVDFEDFENNRKFAIYSNFNVGPAPSYRLGLGTYSGDAGNALGFHEEKSFTTSDRDQDERPGENCALTFKSGWWFGITHCYMTNLNGQFYTEKQERRDWMGIVWNHYKLNYSLKSVTMSFRKV